MGRNVDEIRKRIEKRKQLSKMESEEAKRWGATGFKESTLQSYYSDDNEYSGEHPLFRREVFFFKVLLSIVLVLVVGIVYQREGPYFSEARTYINKALETEFQFATVSQWYEDTFGQSFSLIPTEQPQQTDLATEEDLALPASGKITKNFQSDGQGIIVETTVGERVEAIKSGTVEAIETKPGIGKTVVIQHADGSKTWYGMIGDIQVKIYDSVKAKQEIGKASASDGNAGQYYFAMVKDGKFIDPSQVMSIE